MADHTDDHLFEEIEEDLRAERYAKLWKRYGKYVIAALVALVLGVAGYQGWRSYDIETRQEQSHRFTAAVELLADNKPTQAQQALAALADDAGKGYRLLARLRRAAVLANNGDKASAQKLYDAIAADSALDQTYRDLATLLSVLVVLDSGDSTALRERLKPLTTDENPWRYSAREAAALLSIRAGDRKQAHEQLKALASDAGTPQGIRQRASELSAAIKP